MYVTIVRHSGHADDDRDDQNPVTIAGSATVPNR
jgi:hypothetical protein